MSMIAVAQYRAAFQRVTPICGNCQHEQRSRDEARNCTVRSCAKHGWLVMMSATCKDHGYRQPQIHREAT